MSTAYLNTIQTSCPWILRYLTAAVITNRGRKNVVRELVKIINQESYAYQDPITLFLEALYVRFDFEEAQKHLKECEKVLENDFFLASCREDFVENARCFISEAYCRIHQRIDIRGLSERLNLNPEDGEKWIVNLIRDSRVDARIDFNEVSRRTVGSMLTSLFTEQNHFLLLEFCCGKYQHTAYISADY